MRDDGGGTVSAGVAVDWYGCDCEGLYAAMYSAAGVSG